MFLNASRLAKRELHHHEILATIVYSGGGVWVSVEWAGIVSASPAMSTYKNTATIGKRNNEKMDNCLDGWRAVRVRGRATGSHNRVRPGRSSAGHDRHTRTSGHARAIYG